MTKRNTLLHTPTTCDTHESWEKRYPGGGVRKHPIPNLAAEIAAGKSYQEMVEERSRTLTSSQVSAASPSPQDGQDSAPSRSAKLSRSARKSSRPDSTPLLPTPTQGVHSRSLSPSKRNAELIARGEKPNTQPYVVGYIEAMNIKASRRDSGLLKTPSAADAHTEGMKKVGQKFGDSGTLAQEMATGFINNRFGKALSSSPTSATSTGRGSEEPPCSQEGSPASLFPTPENEEARLTLAISGRKCSESYRKQGPLSSLVRMLLESDRWKSPQMMLTWKAVPMMKRVEIANTQLSLTPSANNSKESVMRFSRLLFQLAPSAHRTDGTGCGLLRTASGQEPGVDVGRLVTKDGQPARMGERAYDRETGRLAQVGLQQQIAMLPTPNSCDSNSENNATGHDDRKGYLGGAIGKSRGLKLQPIFCEWMMGYPAGWTNISED